jgi:hypothetical protein
MTQFDLFAVAERIEREGRVVMPPPAPFVHLSETSRQAAVRIRSRADSLRDRVYAFIVKQGEYGATDAEIEAGTEMSGNTVRPRRGELEVQGRIRNTGKTRATKSGRQAVIWAAAGGLNEGP